MESHPFGEYRLLNCFYSPRLSASYLFISIRLVILMLEGHNTWDGVELTSGTALEAVSKDEIHNGSNWGPGMSLKKQERHGFLA